MAFFGLANDTVNFLAVFGGLINPLAIAYIVLRIRDRAPNSRWFLTLAILTFLPLTWLSLVVMRLGVRIGHVAWVAGLLLMISWKDSSGEFKPRRGHIVRPRTNALAALIQPLSAWMGAATLIVLGGYVLDHLLTKPLLVPTDLDSFFYDVAVQFKAPEVCGKINPYAEGSEAGLGARGFQISYLQSDCYFELAHTTGDLSLCDKVRTAHKRGLDGGEYSPKGCRTRTSLTYGPRYWTKDKAFSQIMENLGYPDTSSRGARSTYDQVLYRSDPATRADFLRRVMALK